MSNLVSNLIQTKKVGSLTKKAILMYMADKASDDGSGIWVSKSNMAADLEMTDRAVRIHIKDMIAMGIVSESGQRQCKSGYTIDYRINLNIIKALQPTRATSERDSPLNDIQSYPCMTFTPTPERDSGKPSIEPPLEPSLFNNNYFDEFYSEYPRKVGKGAARKAWAKAIKKADVHYIISSASLYAKSTLGKDKEFIPHPATWLNGERWEDEIKDNNKNETLDILKEMGLKYDA